MDNGGDGVAADIGFEPTHYVIAVHQGGKTSYVLCQRLLTVDPSEIMPGLAAADVANYFRQHNVPAVPVPVRSSLSGVELRSGVDFRSGVDINVEGNATVVVNPSGAPKKL